MNRPNKSFKLNSTFSTQMYQILNVLFVSIIFYSCTTHHEENKTETSTTQNINLSLIEMDNFLESFDKIYSFNDCKLEIKDYDYSPVKETNEKVADTNVRINSKKVRLYDSNMKLLYSFNIIKSKIEKSVNTSNGTTSYFMDLKCSTKKQSDININSIIIGTGLNYLLIDYKLKKQEISLNLFSHPEANSY